MLLTQFLVVVLVRGCFFLVFVRSYCYCLLLFVVVCFARCPLSLVFSQLDLVLCSCGHVINLDIVFFLRAIDQVGAATDRTSYQSI